jgi:hypothetical protein
MTLDISHVLIDGHYQCVVEFAKKIGLYAPQKPEPHPDTCRFWHRNEPYRLLKVLERPTPEGRACFIDLPEESPMVSVQPFWMRVEDLYAEYVPSNRQWDGHSTRFLANSLAYLDGYGEFVDNNRVFGRSKTTLFTDGWAANSFYFTLELEGTVICNGGLMYYDGNQPGWYVHT